MKGIAFVVLAGTSFAVLDTIAKGLARTYPTPMVVWARYVFHVLVMLLVLWPRWRGGLVRTRRPGLQVVRGLVLGLSSVFFFAALARMPLAEATAIVAISPILVTALAVRWLGERAPPGTWWAMGAGLLGVLLIVRPGSAVFSPAALLPMLTALCGAGYALATRRLAGVDNGIATLFIGGLVAAVLMTMIVPLFWTWPRNPIDALLFVGLGAIGAGGHLFLIRAYELASASVLAPFTYAHTVAAIPLGYFVFDTFPDRPALLGMLLIVCSGLAMALLQRRLAAARGG
jgi:drug/metabolite transporter (DMT)-like permease